MLKGTGFADAIGGKLEFLDISIYEKGEEEVGATDKKLKKVEARFIAELDVTEGAFFLLFRLSVLGVRRSPAPRCFFFFNYRRMARWSWIEAPSGAAPHHDQEVLN